MTKRSNLVVKLLIVIAISMFTLFAVSQIHFAKADVAPTTIDKVSITMDDGADIRLGETSADNGIRFTASLSAADYEGLKANTAYSDVSFGMLIAPAEYLDTYDFTVENLFGAEAKYCWGKAQEGKAQILNLTAGTLSPRNGESEYYIRGSIVDLFAKNTCRDFIGVAYIKVVNASDSSETYKLATYDDVARNMHDMAIAALESGEFSPEEEEIISTAYLTKYTVNYMSEDGEDVLYTEQVYKGAEALVAEIPEKQVGNDLYHFTGWKTEIGGSTEADLGAIIANTDVYATFGEDAIVTLDNTAEKHVFADATMDSYRHAGIYLGNNSYAAGTKVNVSFKMKTVGIKGKDAGMQMWIMNDTGASSSVFALADFDGDSYDDWTTVNANFVCVTTAAQYLARWSALNANDLARVPSDVGEETGVFLFFYALPENALVEVKDITIDYAGDAAVFNTGNSYRHTGLLIAQPTGANVGDKFNVTLQVKANFNLSSSQIYCMQGTGSSDPCASILGSDIRDAESGWLEITFENVVVTTGQQLIDRFGVFGADAAGMVNDVNATDEGIFLFIYIQAANSYFAVKDVVCEVPELEDYGDAAVFNTGDSYRHTGLLIAQPTGANVGDKFNVTLQVKANFNLSSSQILCMQGTGSSDPCATILGSGIRDAESDWLEITFENVVVTTGQQFIDRLGPGIWGSDAAGMVNDVNASDEGIFLFIYTQGANSYFAVKDVVCEVPEVVYSFTSLQDNYACGTLVSDAAGDYTTHYRVSFKYKVTGQGQSGYIVAYKDVLNRSGNAINVTTSTDWTEATFEDVICLTGAQIKDWTANEWSGAYFPNTADDDHGIFIWAFWITGGATIEIKDVVVTPLA